jgi:Methyltransferase domain
MRFGGFFRERSLYSQPWAVAAYRTARRAAAAAGLDVVLRTFYSPIPALDELPPGTLERRSDLAGIDFDPDAQLGWIEGRLAGAMAAFRPPASGDRHTYVQGTVPYPLLDATLLYGVMRGLQPRRVVELGSGASTLVTAQAARENARDGHPLELTVYDPFPGVVGDDLPGLTALHRVRAQDLGPDAFAALEAGDVLFVDTTHTVKVGSDVNFIVLEVLPRLREGVYVHLHDIFLPYEYPRQWLEDYGLYWTEQYLVHALLIFNSGFEVLASMHALQRDRRDAMAELLTPEVADWAGGAFWMRRTAG